MNEKLTREVLERTVRILEKEINKYKTVESALRLEESRLEALLELNQMTGAALQHITDFAMEEAVRLTESRIGYLAFMSTDEKTLTMHSWSQNAMAQCDIINKPKVYPIETTGLWGEAVRQRKPIITNNYDEPNFYKKGYPEGHVRIKRHLNIPVFDGRRIVAVAGVGNKETQYDESDVRQLKLLMQGMWRLILRKWTEWELRESEAKFRKLVETVGAAIFIYQGTKIMFANPTYETLFGYTKEEILSKNFWDVIHPEFQPLIKDRGLSRQRGEKVPCRYEIKILRKNKEERWCDFTLSLIEFEGRPAVLGIAFDITERKRTEVALEESEKRSRLLTSYLLSAQEKERKRISFELHDELGQSLTVLKLKLRSIARGLNDDQPKLKAECFNILQDIDQLIENIRRLTRDLSPTILEDLGLTAAIRWMLHDFAKLNGNQVALNIQDVNHLFSHESQIIIYRIFQEALNNIGKHARARHVSVSAVINEDVVTFIIEDDGKGFSMHLPFVKIPNITSLGLAAMSERARMLGASFSVQSKLGAGTKITLEIPIDNNHADLKGTDHGTVSHHTRR